MAEENRNRIVIGLGKTGRSCAQFLRTHGETFAMMDTRHEPPGYADFMAQYPDVDVYCGDLDLAQLLQASEIIVSPGVAVNHPMLQAAAAQGVPLIGDIELFARHAKKPVIAITGSNAKSTVTTLVGEMGRAAGWRMAVGGNLGVPALDLLNDANTDCYVLELSSFQLETTCSLRAKVAVVLNISEDHMDRYDALQSYVKAKHRIFTGAENIVFNRADALTRPVTDTGATVWSFGLDADGDHAVGMRDMGGESALSVNQGQLLVHVRDVLLPGKHNLENVAASLAIAQAVGWPVASCAAAIRVFRGLPHRCEWVAEKQGVRYYNDSKGTNIGATIAAITGLAGVAKNIILVAGGDGKGADFTALSPCVHEHVKHLVLIGRDAQQIAAACSPTAANLADSLQQAVQQAADIAEAGDVVLLSPACASFDMFSGYDDRGRQFCQAVELLA